MHIKYLISFSPSYFLFYRAKYKSEGVEVTAFTVTVSDKSTARRIETFIQSQLILLGYLLESNADSSHTLFSNGR